MKKRNKELLLIVAFLTIFTNLFIWIGILTDYIAWDNLLRFVIPAIFLNTILFVFIFLNKQRLKFNLFVFLIILSLFIYVFQFFYLRMYFELNIMNG